MAPKEKQKIEIEKSYRDPLLSSNQAVTVDCSDFLGTALVNSQFCQRFFRWYNQEMVKRKTFCGNAKMCSMLLTNVTWSASVRSAPKPRAPPSEVWINKPVATPEPLSVGEVR